MYVWSEATNPYWVPGLRGSTIEKEAWTERDGILESWIYLGVITDGLAEFSNSNIWGWGNHESGSSFTNYGGGTRTVEASGSGVLEYGVFGLNAASYSVDFTLPGGGGTGVGPHGLPAFFFNGGISGTYNMSGD